MSKLNPVSANFNFDIAGDIAIYVTNRLKAPVVRGLISTLGGKERVSIWWKLSLDPQDTWANKIFENSRYMIFTVSRFGTLEQSSRGYRVDKKFRKTHVDTADEIVFKINKYLDQVR